MIDRAKGRVVGSRDSAEDAGIEGRWLRLHVARKAGIYVAAITDVRSL